MSAPDVGLPPASFEPPEPEDDDGLPGVGMRRVNTLPPPTNEPIEAWGAKQDSGELKNCAFSMPPIMARLEGSSSGANFDFDFEDVEGDGEDEVDDSDGGTCDDSDDEDLLVIKAWIPTMAFVCCGEKLQCGFELNQPVPEDQVERINEYLCFNWLRSIDKKGWELVRTGTMTSGADTFTPTADELGYFVKCECWFDDSKPATSDSLLVGVSEKSQADMKLALKEQTRGFTVLAQRDDPECDAWGDKFYKTHIVMDVHFVRIYMVKEGAPPKIVCKCMWTQHFSVRTDTKTPTEDPKLRLRTPSISVLCKFPDLASLNFFTFVFRCFQALSIPGICNSTFVTPEEQPQDTSPITAAWKAGTFNLEDHKLQEFVAVSLSPKGNTFLQTLDKNLRAHLKSNRDWQLAQDTLKAALAPKDEDENK
eukprot:TRINITY_DN52369_c0_g1_i1.p1 TRINITY_DN52369_c0_g1~~TRINITY_DN52369_c0_g1_i1.p1  ORF type:complete len:422 (-),score=33.40 TRINITY_DN52369_c0_g1_i1:337-1602(-)